MANKTSLPKLLPANYQTAKKDPDFVSYVSAMTHDIHYNFCNNLTSLPSNIQSVIVNIQNKTYSFTAIDQNELEFFVTNIDTYLDCNQRISSLKSVNLPDLFNDMKNATGNYDMFRNAVKTKLRLGNARIAGLVGLFSIVKHCQDPDKYPIVYPFYKNLHNYYFRSLKKNDYDKLYDFYNNKFVIPPTDTPKHVYFAAYMHQLAINLANDLAKNITSYSPNDIGGIFNIKDYDSIMGVKRGKKNEVILPAAPPQSVTTMNGTIITSTQSTTLDFPRHPLNLILYGPPGTGKTYNTLFHALAIIKGEDIAKLQEEVKTGVTTYENLKQEYDRYIDSNQIVFTTFHQSMSYEDFIEGIKPIPIEGEIVAKHENDSSKSKDPQFGNGTTTIANLSRIKYEVSDGIFKQICNNAKKIEVKNISAEIDFTKTRIFKMSLGEKGKDADSVFDYCVDNEVIALGWGGSKDFSKCTTKSDFKKLDSTWGATAIEIFKEWMKNGDVVLISDGTKEIKGIAQIEGNYEFRDDPVINMHQFRKVKWLYAGDNIPISKLYDKNLSKQSIYGFCKEDKNGVINNGGIKVDVLNEIITGKINETEQEKYVLIIDEINRGNVAQIFGELITLIEPSKRLGNSEEMKAILPYSSVQKGEPVYFGVPNNLYIIGTMNTADRSVEALDTALRRRFSFEEMMPKPELLKDEKQIPLEVCGVKLGDLLTTINARIVALKDREHQIGHSYFMGSEKETNKEEWLKNVFKDKIIPLLQEYFYGDYKKIYYVLGPGFVEPITDNKPENIFPVKIDDDFDIDESLTRYEIKSFDTINIEAAIKDLVDSIRTKQQKTEKKRKELEDEGYKSDDIEQIMKGADKSLFTPEKKVEPEV